MTLEMNSITFYNVNILIIHVLGNVYEVEKNILYYYKNMNILIFRDLLTLK